jgi:hypothetical protein
MSVYPTQAVLKSKLKEVCSSESLCETLSAKFAEQPVSCNHRVAQVAAFNALKLVQDAKTEDAASCAEVLTSFVDVNSCRK